MQNQHLFSASFLTTRVLWQVGAQQEHGQQCLVSLPPWMLGEKSWLVQGRCYSWESVKEAADTLVDLGLLFSFLRMENYGIQLKTVNSFCRAHKIGHVASLCYRDGIRNLMEAFRWYHFFGRGSCCTIYGGDFLDNQIIVDNRIIMDNPLTSECRSMFVGCCRLYIQYYTCICI